MWGVGRLPRAYLLGHSQMDELWKVTLQILQARCPSFPAVVFRCFVRMVFVLSGEVIAPEESESTQTHRFGIYMLG